nr:matrixin family metalloprotease [Promineifilum sp.]
MKKAALALTFAINLFAGLLWFSPANAFCITSNTGGCAQSGSGWPGATVNFSSQGYSGSNSTFNNAFVSALNNWNGLSSFSFTSTASSANPCSGSSNSTRGWQFASTNCGSAFGANTLATTSTWFTYNSSTGLMTSLTDADIVFNTAFSWDVHSGSASARDFRRVASHELGHALGLDRSSSTAALMYYLYSESVETPQTDDINGLRTIYGGSSSSMAVEGGNVTFTGNQGGNFNPTLAWYRISASGC